MLFDAVPLGEPFASTSGRSPSALTQACASRPGSLPFAASGASGSLLLHAPLPDEFGPLLGIAESQCVCESPIVTMALPWQVYWTGSLLGLVIAGNPSRSAAVRLPTPLL